MRRKLDLSKLSEEEAQHVLQVVQRDLDLRKKEEERLGGLKCKIEEEGTKRKLLTKQAKFNEGHCIHCLEPFTLLVNSKRRCLDCCLFTCKNCSKFHKKEYGWVCDPCRVARIVKVGSLDWFYSHVRSRFKHFGSAKVMRSLHKRRQPGEKPSSGLFGSADEQGGSHSAYESYIPGEYKPQAMAGVLEVNEDTLDDSQAQHYSLIRRSKRLLSVHPVDFDMESEYSTQSRRHSFQLPSSFYDRNSLQESYSEFSIAGSGPTEGESRKGSLFAEADLASVFRDIHQEKGHNIAIPESQFNTEVRLKVSARRKSLDKTKSEEIFIREHRLPRTRSFPRVWNLGDTDVHLSLPQENRGAQYYADMESSEDERAPEYPVYQRHFIRHRSKSGSQENSGSQISDLSKRMSSIEKMLSKLEEKMTPQSAESPNLKGRHTTASPVGSEASGVLTDADIEEEKLKKKLGELADNISDKGPSSEEENARRKIERQQELSSSSEEIHNEAVKRSSAVALCDITTEALRTINATEKALRDLAGADELCYEASPNRSSHLTLGEKDSNASEAKDTDEAYRKLEENVYMAASTNYNLEQQLQELEERARSRQSHTTSTTDSELSELEDKVASAAAQVQYTESEVSDIENRIAALSTAGVNVSPEDKPKRKQDRQAAELQQPIRRKVSNSSATNNDAFDRNSQYRESVTQRNPSNKRRLDRVFPKPAVSM